MTTSPRPDVPTAAMFRAWTSAVTERRKRRSSDTITALHYQLAAARRDAGMTAVVLVDDWGCLVAGAGAWPVCEELAAYAPLLSAPRERLRTMVSMTIADLSKQVESVPIEIDGMSVLLCGRGASSNKRVHALSRAATGVRRIFAA